MHKIADKLTQVKHRIQQAARLSGRFSDEITLLAVSKKQSIEAILEAYESGQRIFGENYLQEAEKKIEALKRLSDIEWHFIGPLQSNKAKKIANSFSWVHSLDRLKVAQKLNKYRQLETGKLNICIQVNIDEEQSKSGVLPQDLLLLAKEVSKLENLSLRGLMAIPSVNQKPGEEENAFSRLRSLFNELRLHNKRLAQMDTLSMGMSADLEVAIREGATLVRIGTDIFGPRAEQIADEALKV